MTKLIINFKKNKTAYFLLLLVFMFSLSVAEYPGYRWSNFDYFWVDARNIGLGSVFRESLLNLTPWSPRFDLGFNIASIHFFPFSPFLLISPEYGVTFSNFIAILFGAYYANKVAFYYFRSDTLAVMLALLFVCYPAFHAMSQNQMGFGSMLLMPLYVWWTISCLNKESKNIATVFLLTGMVLILSDMMVVIYAFITVITTVITVGGYSLIRKSFHFNSRLFATLLISHIVWFLPWILWHLSLEVTFPSVSGLHGFLLSQTAYYTLLYPEYTSGMFLDQPAFYLTMILILFTDRQLLVKILLLFSVYVVSVSIPFILDGNIDSPTYLRAPLNVSAALGWIIAGISIFMYRYNGRLKSKWLIELLLLLSLLVDFLINWTLSEPYVGPKSVDVLYYKLFVILSIYLVRITSRYVISGNYFSLFLLMISLVSYTYGATDLRKTYSKNHNTEKYMEMQEQFSCLKRTLDQSTKVDRVLLTGTANHKKLPYHRMYRRESGLYPELLPAIGYPTVGAYREKFDTETGKYYSELFNASMHHHNFPPHVSILTQESLVDLGVTHVILFVDESEVDEIKIFEEKYKDKLQSLEVCTNSGTISSIYKTHKGAPLYPLKNKNKKSISIDRVDEWSWSVVNKATHSVDLIIGYLPYKEAIVKDKYGPLTVKNNDKKAFSTVVIPSEYNGILEISYKDIPGNLAMYWYIFLFSFQLILISYILVKHFLLRHSK